MDTEQSLIHRVDSGEITAAEALKEATNEAAEFGGSPSEDLISALASRGLIVEEAEAVVPAVTEMPAEEVAVDMAGAEEPVVEVAEPIEEMAAVEEVVVTEAEPVEAEIPADEHI